MALHGQTPSDNGIIHRAAFLQRRGAELMDNEELQVSEHYLEWEL